MPRPKKDKPNRSDGRFEIKKTVGHTFEGDPIRKSFYSNISKEDAKKQADDYLIAQKASALAGLSFVTSEVSFSDWAKTWLLKYKKGNVKESTYLETYERTVVQYLIPFFKNAYLQNIRPVDITQFYGLMSEKYYETTIKKMRLCLNAIFETAIENNLCYKNPAKNVSYSVKKVGAKKRTYSTKEVNKIFAFAKEHRYGHYIYILLELGLRCSELLGLKWGDFNFKSKTVTISRAATDVKNTVVIDVPKSKTSIRTLPVSSELINYLKPIKGDDEEFIINHNNRPQTPANFTKHRYKTFFDDLEKKHPEIMKLSPHELRHTCGTLLYAKTKDIFAVSKFLGHADIGITTKLYVHEDVNLLRKNLRIK